MRTLRRPCLGVVCAALLVLTLPALLAAEEERLDRAPRQPVVLASGAVAHPQGTNPDSMLQPKSGYGIDDLQVVNIPFAEFLPRTSSGAYTSLCCITEGARWATGGDNFLVAGIDAGLVPNGAHLEQIAFYVGDTNAVTDLNFGGYLCRTWVDSDGTNRDQDCPVFISTLSNPGDTVITAAPNIPVRYRYDIDGDSTAEVVNYMVFAEFGINGQQVYDGSVRLRQARLLFRRQISPAPSTPTFNDVAPGDFGFQHIEALAASGITGGCGGGNYCPNSFLTRAQMAVFLAKALGLHWPAF
jgi:hypothetical protein